MSIAGLLLFFSICFPSQICIAQPTPTIRYLMEDDKVSMFDFGMYRLQEYLTNQIDVHGYFIDNNKPTLTLSYSWNANRIKIRLHYLLNKIDNKEKIKNGIKNAIRTIRLNLLLDENGKPLAGRKYSQMGQLFSHFDYTMSNRPENSDMEIDQVTEIEVVATSQKTKTYKGETIRCKTMLLDNMKSLSCSEP